MVNKRKVTRNIIDEKTGRVLEVETEVTTDDSDEDVVNPDGTIGKKPKRQRSITFSQFENLKSLDIISSEECDDVETVVGKN